MRLYRLSKPTSFHCSNCGQIKEENHLAVAIKGNANRSRRILCRACYYELAKGEPIDPAAVKPRKPSQNKQQPLG
jgi:hypothetical protein